MALPSSDARLLGQAEHLLADRVAHDLLGTAADARAGGGEDVFAPRVGAPCAGVGHESRAEDLGGYYRIPADTRDLNYDKYFIEGIAQMSQLDDYTSHNTTRLNVAQVRDVLARLKIVQEMMRA